MRQFTYDRRVIDMDLFEMFQDQGVALHEIQKTDTQELLAWKKKEDDQAERARERYIKRDLISLVPQPHDYYNIQPESYNLSIQYDREKRNAEQDAKNKSKKDKKGGGGVKKEAAMKDQGDKKKEMDKILEEKADKDEKQDEAVQIMQIADKSKKKMNYKSSSLTQ